MSIGTADLQRRGLMFVLSSPSGAGKSTLARELLKAHPDLMISVSVTTRKRRPSELDGSHYHFVDREQFSRMQDHGELLEWAEVHGNLYATPRAPVEKALGEGRDVLFDIDWQGTDQLSAIDALRPDLIRVFVLPPDFRELRSRLERRAEDAPDVIGRRLENARLEIGKWDRYDYVVINRDVTESFACIEAILSAERMRRERVIGLADFVGQLLADAEVIALAGGEPNA